MQKWEYKIIEITGIYSNQDREEYGDELTKLGADGWELTVTTSAGSQYHAYLIFKRPIYERTSPPYLLAGEKQKAEDYWTWRA